MVSKFLCDFRWFLLLAAAVALIHIQDGVPRTAYEGAVISRYSPPRHVFLVGPDSFRLLGIKRV